MYAYPKLQVLMIAALNQERLKLTPDVSVEHWLLLRIEALILKHWTWVSSQYQWHRKSWITTRFGSRSMDFMASNFETGMNNRITWTEDMIFNFDRSLQVLLQYGGAGSDTINAARDADGFSAIMQVGWEWKVWEDGLGQVLRTRYCWWKISCQTCSRNVNHWIYIHLLGTSWLVQDVHQEEDPSKWPKLRFLAYLVTGLGPIISELPILSIFPTGWEV